MNHEEMGIRTHAGGALERGRLVLNLIRGCCQRVCADANGWGSIPVGVCLGTSSSFNYGCGPRAPHPSARARACLAPPSSLASAGFRISITTITTTTTITTSPASPVPHRRHYCHTHCSASTSQTSSLSGSEPPPTLPSLRNTCRGGSRRSPVAYRDQNCHHLLFVWNRVEEFSRQANIERDLGIPSSLMRAATFHLYSSSPLRHYHHWYAISLCS